MRVEFVEFCDGVIGNAAEHVAEPVEGIHFYEFTRGDEAAEDGSCLPAIVAAEKHPVAASMKSIP
jgi:hypothetical protein